jgi:hypothetical protein
MLYSKKLNCALSWLGRSLFACRSVWVWNLVSDIKGGTQTESVWAQGAEEDIWTDEGRGEGRMEKIA